MGHATVADFDRTPIELTLTVLLSFEDDTVVVKLAN